MGRETDEIPCHFIFTDNKEALKTEWTDKLAKLP